MKIRYIVEEERKLSVRLSLSIYTHDDMNFRDKRRG